MLIQCSTDINAKGDSTPCHLVLFFCIICDTTVCAAVFRVFPHRKIETEDHFADNWLACRYMYSLEQFALSYASLLLGRKKLFAVHSKRIQQLLGKPGAVSRVG